MSYWYCLPCNRDFNTEYALLSHLTHSGRHAGTYCRWCNVDFYGSDELDDHNDREHYQCGSCNNLYETEQDLDNHIEDSHWHCSPCNKFFNSEDNLAQHCNSSYHKSPDFICNGENCERGFISWSALVKHFEEGNCSSGLNRELLNKFVLQMNTNAARRLRVDGTDFNVDYYLAEPAISYTRLSDGTYECANSGCNKEFRTYLSLRQHFGSGVHGEKMFRCPGNEEQDCGMEFSMLSALTAHVESGKCGVHAARVRDVRTVVQAVNRNINRIGDGDF